MALEVGQELWFVPGSRWEKPCAVKVVKIGRIWATMAGTPRADKNTLRCEEYKTRYYLSKEVWEQSIAVEKRWAALRRALDRRDVPPEVGVAEIEKAARILGLLLDPVPRKAGG